MDHRIAARNQLVHRGGVADIGPDLLDPVDPHSQAANRSDHFVAFLQQGRAERPAQFTAGPGHHDTLDTRHNTHPCFPTTTVQVANLRHFPGKLTVSDFNPHHPP